MEFYKSSPEAALRPFDPDDPPLAKADWGLESCSLYGVERWPFLRGCFTLKSWCSFNPNLSSWPLYSVWLLFGGDR